MSCEHLETMSGYLTACRARLLGLPQHVGVSYGRDKKPGFHHGLLGTCATGLWREPCDIMPPHHESRNTNNTSSIVATLRGRP